MVCGMKPALSCTSSQSSLLSASAASRQIEPSNGLRQLCVGTQMKPGESGGHTATMAPLYPSPVTRLPRVKCPRAAVGGSPRKNPHLSPRTPRRRSGRLAAGAALTFFNTLGGSQSPSLSSLMISPSSIQQLQTYFTTTAAAAAAAGDGHSRAASASITPPSSPPLARTLSDGGNSIFSVFNASPTSSPLIPRSERQALSNLSRNISVVAALPSGKGDGESADGRGASTTSTVGDPSAEHSRMANEELLLFFYQLDLNMRLQVGPP